MADAPRPRRPTEAILTVLSGARSGHRHHLNTDFAALGRHPSNDLAFDPLKDIDVSARHAAVFRQGGGYVVRDLGSTNGTWLNGTRIRSDQALEPGDTIRLGIQGPELEFGVVEVEERPLVPDESAPGEEGAPSPAAATVPRALDQNQSTTDLKLRIEVARQTDRLRQRLFGVLAVVLIAVGAGIGWLAWTARQQRTELSRERDRLLRAADSLESQFATTATDAGALRQVLDSAQREAVRLRESIATQAPDAVALSSFEAELARAAEASAPLLRAAGFDAAAAASPSVRAVVWVFADSGARRRSASGFVVRTRADTAWVITSRRAVLDEAGQPAMRLALSPAGSGTVYRARFLAVHDSADLALLRVVSGRRFPAVRVDSTAPPPPGEPLALLGFPSGPDATTGGAAPVIFTGTVARTRPDRIEVDGYGAAWAGGSPVFNTAGEVVGVTSTGGEGGRIITVTPARAIGAWPWVTGGR